MNAEDLERLRAFWQEMAADYRPHIIHSADASRVVAALAALRSVMAEHAKSAAKADTWAQRAGESERSRLAAQVERDEARGQVRSLTAETRHACQLLAEEEADSDALRARLSRAREALDRYDEEPPHYRAGLDEENAWRARQEAALADLRSALTEEAPHGQV